MTTKERNLLAKKNLEINQLRTQIKRSKADYKLLTAQYDLLVEDNKKLHSYIQKLNNQ